MRGIHFIFNILIQISVYTMCVCVLQCVCVMDKGNYEHDELTGLNIAFTGCCLHAF